MNSSNGTTELFANLQSIPGLSCDGDEFNVRDIWTHSDMGTFKGSWTTAVGGHDAAFIIVECVSE